MTYWYAIVFRDNRKILSWWKCKKITAVKNNIPQKLKCLWKLFNIPSPFVVHRLPFGSPHYFLCKPSHAPLRVQVAFATNLSGNKRWTKRITGRRQTPTRRCSPPSIYSFDLSLISWYSSKGSTSSFSLKVNNAKRYYENRNFVKLQIHSCFTHTVWPCFF